MREVVRTNPKDGKLVWNIMYRIADQPIFIARGTFYGGALLY
jgi:hypothetical protein